MKRKSRVYIFLLFYLASAIFLIGCGDNDAEDEQIIDRDQGNALPTVAWTDGIVVKKESSTVKPVGKLMLVIIDSQRYQIKVEERKPPKRIKQWCEENDNIIAVINGGFFMEDNDPTALLITDQGKKGQSYVGSSKGMFFVDHTGTIGITNLEAGLKDSSRYKYAVQSFPMLIEGTKKTVQTTSIETAKRSFIGLDTHGNLILGNTENGSFTFNDLANDLEGSTVSLKSVLNLDGGSSSGLCVKDQEGDIKYIDNSLSSVPNAIVIKKK